MSGSNSKSDQEYLDPRVNKSVIPFICSLKVSNYNNPSGQIMLLKHQHFILHLEQIRISNQMSYTIEQGKKCRIKIFDFMREADQITLSYCDYQNILLLKSCIALIRLLHSRNCISSFSQKTL